MKTISKLFALMLCATMAFGQEKGQLPLPAARNVTLPLSEYDRLVELARKSAKTREVPPLPYALKRAELKLHVNNLSVLGTVLLEGEVFSKGAAKVPLTSGLTILNAHQDGKNVPMQQEGTNAVAILPGQSEFALTLDTGLQLTQEAGRASFLLPVPAAGSTKLSLMIPGEHTNVRISPGLITNRVSENGQTKIEATLAPGQTANIWWATREVATPTVPREVRFLSDVKTLVTVTESEMSIAALADITVVQGEPAQFAIAIPAGYEVTGASGAAVESSEIQSGALILKLTNGTLKSYQFLISMERPISATKEDTPFLSFKDTQRETGELLVEGAGAMELAATEGGGLKRMDLKEVSPYLRSLSRFPLQAAFRYHRQPNETPTLALAWTRFPDGNVLAAVAEYAVVTTLVTSEGRSLTEVKLIVKNHAQPFLKVALPPGASILSAEVAGEKVKPVIGTDGSRVPLLRAGFRPTGLYEVSFVFLHSGAPFAKKGGSDLALPAMDVPISVLQWEVFLPDQYKVKDFGGDTIAVNTLPAPMIENSEMQVAGVLSGGGLSIPQGAIGGVVLDPQGAVISGATVTVTNTDKGITRTTTTDSAGQWVVSGMPSGRVKVEAAMQGFKSTVMNAKHSEDKAG
ncbi:MAG TPA: carboxypeptidase-like regulatory domain-containing protein, partial [Candidatus Angelobacter sp.]|nr:carboxypeptidase-like regulatory domain-containing protein [Candidatus Angelobacter sp.]